MDYKILLVIENLSDPTIGSTYHKVVLPEAMKEEYDFLVSINSDFIIDGEGLDPRIDNYKKVENILEYYGQDISPEDMDIKDLDHLIVIGEIY